VKAGLFCKSCVKDLAWLKQAIRSIQTNWKHPWQDTQWVIAMDSEAYLSPGMQELDRRHIEFRYVEPWPDRYTHAMAMKACADLFCHDAEIILVFDSDMVLSRPTDLTDLLRLGNGRPALMFEHWHSERDPATRAMAQMVWGAASIRSTGIVLDRDWMVCPTWLFWPSTFAGARGLVEVHHKMPFLQAVYSKMVYDYRLFPSHPMTFCDIENLGIYASKFEPHRYEITQMGLTDFDGVVVQRWSYGDL